MATRNTMVHPPIDSFTVYDLANSSGSDAAANTLWAYGGGYVFLTQDLPDGGTDGVGVFGCVVNYEAEADDAWADGDKLYVDASTGKLTDDPTNNTWVGWARGAKVATETRANVRINGPKGEDNDTVT